MKVCIACSFVPLTMQARQNAPDFFPIKNFGAFFLFVPSDLAVVISEAVSLLVIEK